MACHSIHQFKKGCIDSIIRHMVDARPQLDIIKDAAYFKVLKKDMRRQQMRRAAKKLGNLYEILFKHPLWQKKSDTSKTDPRRPKLSVCIMTMNSADRIAPLLKYSRDFSDEIVVGVDSKTTDATLEVCQKLADVAFVIESTALTCNAGLEALVSRCTGDWVLRLDDDEYPEPLLKTFLPGLLMTDSSITHYKLPRLHLSSVSPLAWINDSYLYPDYQMRLFRNDRALLTFPGAVGHLGIQCAGKKGRVNTVNLVHLNLAINPRYKREEKLKTYIQRLNGGWVHPVNEQALLFEAFNFREEPYTSKVTSFDNLLREVTLHQREKYEGDSQKQ
ncbi:MAG: glycosyltransferase [Cyanobacteria bacterium P01_H01_bin.74]